ncbi:MAG: SMP-30/gluconolactonase/LRE family protein, partial [Flavobacteriaceae bacterium]
MRFIIKLFIGLFFISAYFGCAEEQRLSEDFTSEFGFTAGIEGPAVNADGELFAVNFEREGTIGRVNKAGEAEVFISLPEGSIGNGIRFDLDGNMFVADYLGHTIYRIKKGSKTPEVWAKDSTM